MFVKLASKLSGALEYRFGIAQTMPLLFEFIVFYLCVCECTAFDRIKIDIILYLMQWSLYSYHMFFGTGSTNSFTVE